MLKVITISRLYDINSNKFILELTFENGHKQSFDLMFEPFKAFVLADPVIKEIMAHD